MNDYSIYSDFENYIKENEAIIEYLEDHQSLLNDFVSPIIKTMTYIMNLNKEDPDQMDLFQYGFEYLFENIEQIKLYLSHLNHSFEELDRYSLFIRFVFNFEEMKVEIEKLSEVENLKILKKIDEALEYFEDHIQLNIQTDDIDQKYVDFYYELLTDFPEIVPMNQAFEEYCSIYGI